MKVGGNTTLEHSVGFYSTLRRCLCMLAHTLQVAQLAVIKRERKSSSSNIQTDKNSVGYVPVRGYPCTWPAGYSASARVTVPTLNESRGLASTSAGASSIRP